MDKPGLTGKIFRKIIPFFISIFLLILFIAYIIPKPPLKEFEAFHKMLNNTTSTHLFDMESYADADFFRNKAFNEWQNQNNKFFLKRNYTETERMILMAISIMEESNDNIIKNCVINKNLNNIYNLEDSAMKQQENRKNWIDDALMHSKNRETTALIIDNFNQYCYLLENGKLIYKIPVKTEINQADNNENEALEGCYYITCKNYDEKIKNHKSIFLNFSEKTDTLRANNSSILNENNDIKISKKIIIHVDGDTEFKHSEENYTLTNQNMEVLFPKVKIGTRVVIVDSAIDIPEIENEKLRHISYQ